MIHLPTATIEVHNGMNQQTIEAVLLALKHICQAISALQKKSTSPAATPTCAIM
jgi:hypothetical protein